MFAKLGLFLHSILWIRCSLIFSIILLYVVITKQNIWSKIWYNIQCHKEINYCHVMAWSYNTKTRHLNKAVNNGWNTWSFKKIPFISVYSKHKLYNYEQRKCNKKYDFISSLNWHHCLFSIIIELYIHVNYSFMKDEAVNYR